jgi:hypothetical protein
MIRSSLLQDLLPMPDQPSFITTLPIIHMRARYSIYQNENYILETFNGAVTYPKLEQFVIQQCADARIAQHYHTVSDFSLATLHLSIEEVTRFAGLICSGRQLRTGRRAIVINGSRNFVFVDVFRSRIEQALITAQCFHYRTAACNWILAMGDLPVAAAQ